MAVTPGHQAVIRYVEETTAGTTPANPALLLFSPEVQGITMGLDKNQQESLDIGELDVHEYFSVKNSYSVTVNFHLYDVDRILDAFTDRNGDQTPKSYTLEVIPDQDGATPHYFRGTGWKPSNIEFSTDDDAPWTVAITFEGGIWADPVTTDPGIGTGSRETKADYDLNAVDPTLKHYATAAVTLDGSAWAVLLGSFNVTIEQGVAPQYNIGSADPVATATVFGGRKITGTGDISLDEGASEQWARVSALSSHEIRVPFGVTTGDQVLVLEGVTFPSIELDVSADTDVLRGGQSFTAQTISRATVA